MNSSPGISKKFPAWIWIPRVLPSFWHAGTLTSFVVDGHTYYSLWILTLSEKVLNPS